VHAGIINYINSVTTAELDNEVNSNGNNGHVFTNTIAEILTHITSHSQYHRGQIEMLIENETGIYFPTIYMAYLRQDV